MLAIRISHIVGVFLKIHSSAVLNGENQWVKRIWLNWLRIFVVDDGGENTFSSLFTAVRDYWSSMKGSKLIRINLGQLIRRFNYSCRTLNEFHFSCIIRSLLRVSIRRSQKATHVEKWVAKDISFIVIVTGVTTTTVKEWKGDWHTSENFYFILSKVLKGGRFAQLL